MAMSCFILLQLVSLSFDDVVMVFEFLFLEYHPIWRILIFSSEACRHEGRPTFLNFRWRFSLRGWNFCRRLFLFVLILQFHLLEVLQFIILSLISFRFTDNKLLIFLILVNFAQLSTLCLFYFLFCLNYQCVELSQFWRFEVFCFIVVIWR